MFRKHEISKENIIKVIIALVIMSIILLSLSVLTDTNDRRKQVSSNDSTEEALCSILSDVKGVGNVEVMVQYTNDNAVSGVIVTAQGAGNAVIKNNIIKGVATLFDIPASNVMVFEKSMEGE